MKTPRSVRCFRSRFVVHGVLRWASPRRCSPRAVWYGRFWSPAATKALSEHDGDDDDVLKVEFRTSPIASTIVRAVDVELVGVTKKVKIVVARTSRVYVGDERPYDAPLPAAPEDVFL